MLHRSSPWIWVGRIVAVLALSGLAVYLARVGSAAANKLVLTISVLVPVAGLLAPYLLPPPSSTGPVSDPDRVEDSGSATATSGGQAISGLQTTAGAAPVRVSRSGDARADGPESVAISGIQQHPEPQQQPGQHL